MPPNVWWPILAVAAFLSGSIPVGLLIARAKGVDIRKHGSGNIGATNVGRVLGRRYFWLCFVLDFAKGFVPTLAAGLVTDQLGHWTMPGTVALAWLAVMVAAILGHVFSPWLGFKGGKGVATGLGAMMGIIPAMAVPALAAFVVFGVCLAIWRYVSLASLVAAVSVPGFVIAQALVMGGESSRALVVAGPFVGVGVLVAALVVWRHRANLGRIRAGTEPKLGHRVHAQTQAS